jgi:hypothetical protein
LLRYDREKLGETTRPLLCFSALVVLVVFTLPGMTVEYRPLPNPKLTPGVADKNATRKIICGNSDPQPSNITVALRHQVFVAYRLGGDADPYCKPKGCEVDRLIGSQLGGTDDLRNLWPQPISGAWNLAMKNRIQKRLKREVCRGRLSLEAAQWAISQDWTAVYRRYFGDPR